MILFLLGLLAGFILGVVFWHWWGYDLFVWLWLDRDREPPTRQPEPEPGAELAPTEPPAAPVTWRGLRRGEYDPRFPSIHPAVWGATGTPADPVVGDVPAAFWDDVANIHVDGSDMSP